MDMNTLYIETQQQQIVRQTEQRRLMHEAQAALKSDSQPMMTIGTILKYMAQAIINLSRNSRDTTPLCPPREAQINVN